MIIKICGMRDARNIREVEKLRPTMMGFICWDGSQRNVVEVPVYLPSCIRVGVFVNPPVDYVRQMVNLLHLDRIQLHGEESVSLCQDIIAATGLPLIKAIAVRTQKDIENYLPYVGIADMLLFDTKCKTVGGSGELFDWDILQHYNGVVPFLLAGGIGPADAQRVREFHHPRFLGIDINSRFETAPAQKNIASLQQFINTIRA